MGANDAKQNEKDDKRRKAINTAANKWGSRRVTVPADWGSASPELVLRAIEAITRDGGAIRFGYTRDGGALAVGLYENGEANTVYLKPSDDLETFLQEVIETYAK